MAVYCISDTHFGHSNILRYRTEFESIEQHDWTITNNILNTCGKRDSLYILGDVCLYRDSWKYVEEIANTVEFLHIALGNHCVSDDTEILCENEWKPAKDISVTDSVASVDLKTDTMRFRNPVNVWSVGYQDMVSLKSDKIDELVTNRHNVVYKGCLTPVSNIPNKTFVKDYKNSSVVDRRGIDLSDDWLRLITWVVCDGTLVQDKEYITKKRVQFKLSKERKINRLSSLLDRMGLKYTLRLCKKTGVNKMQPYYITLYGDYAREIFRQLDGTKKFPESFRDMNKHQFESFYEELSETDGNLTCNVMRITTINKDDAELVQYCAITNGYDCRHLGTDPSGSGFGNGKRQYVLYITNDSSKSTKNVTKELLSTKLKSTAITTIDGTIVTRRDGKVSITGNCCERKGSPSLQDHLDICKSVFAMKKYKSSWLTHAPLHPEELRGKFNIHGHVHSNNIKDLRYFNASCENINYTPVNLADVLINLEEVNGV